jgi:cell division protein FtsB
MTHLQIKHKTGGLSLLNYNSEVSLNEIANYAKDNNELKNEVADLKRQIEEMNKKIEAIIKK